MPRPRTATPARRAQPAPCEHVAEVITRQIAVKVEHVEAEVDEAAELELVGMRCDRVRTQVDDGQGGTRVEVDGEILARIPEIRPSRPPPVAVVTREPRQVRVEHEAADGLRWRCAKCRRWINDAGGEG